MATDKWANPRAMWDERFSQTEPAYGEKPNGFLESQAHRLKPGMKVLVPADGYGRNGIWLAKQGLEVHTVDLSPVGVERARKNAQAAGVKITMEVADLSTWNWPVAEYGAVVAIFLHLPPDARAKVHASMLRALKPGGIVILEAFSPEQLKYKSGGPKDVALLYTAESLSRDFAEEAGHMETVLLEEKVVELSEGHMHSGPGAVVRAVFRKR
jgi:SAM-dependent methyltransferase